MYVEAIAIHDISKENEQGRNVGEKAEKMVSYLQANQLGGWELKTEAGYIRYDTTYERGADHHRVDSPAEVHDVVPF